MLLLLVHFLSFCLRSFLAPKLLCLTVLALVAYICLAGRMKGCWTRPVGESRKGNEQPTLGSLLGKRI